MKIPSPSTLEIPGIHHPTIIAEHRIAKKQKYSYSIKIEFDF